MLQKQRPFFVTIPHSGEKVPEFCDWLQTLPEEILMCDVDRFVDQLYEPALEQLKIPFVKTQWHRYAADLNRVPEDVDMTSVLGNMTPAGTHNRGFHWVVTTTNEPLMRAPMSPDMHQKLVELIYEPFHQTVRDLYEKIDSENPKAVYQLDVHSMPSMGTKMHRDPGQQRADIVVSDCRGQSSSSPFVDLVLAAYSRAGFRVGYNWPYFGGRVSEQYGEPKKGHHVVQVEINRSLYMDEKTKKMKPDMAKLSQEKILQALDYITKNIEVLSKK
ncbi:MAG: formiminoglutamase [Bdellovibrio sp. CG10_big_fil_rev_8_21_14_0_10_47_8]|nr:MAG: formiminoglutamase [Bdellovibrio sp. CG10_big_fil_rev_8_21_14_0_10_47_8]